MLAAIAEGHSARWLAPELDQIGWEVTDTGVPLAFVGCGPSTGGPDGLTDTGVHIDPVTGIAPAGTRIDRLASITADARIADRRVADRTAGAGRHTTTFRFASPRDAIVPIVTGAGISLSLVGS